jgi:Arc/MetJ family transcription regulator
LAKRPAQSLDRNPHQLIAASTGDVYDRAVARASVSATRTNIVIDDRLMERAMRVSGAATKRETVERGLKLLVALKRQERIRRYRGGIKWRGDLEAMRRDR